MFQTKTPVAVLAGMAVAGRFCWRRWWLPHQPGGVAVTWGANGWGSLVTTAPPTRKVPVVVDRSREVLAGKTVTAISAGDRRVCDGRP